MARVTLALLGLVGVGVSYRVRPENVHRVTLVVGWCTYVWFMYAFARNGMPPTNATGLVLLVLLITLPLSNVKELVASGVAMVLSLIYLGLTVTDPAVPLPNLMVMFLMLNLGAGFMSVTRSTLEKRLQEANRTLETRVQERTASLEETVTRLHAEARVREEAERRALSASEAKSVFLANMSHELRTPLNAVLGYTEIVREEAEELERGDMVEDLDRVEVAARHLVGLIDAILDLSRVESGSVTVTPAPCPLRKVVDRAVELVPGLGSSQVAFAAEVPDVEVLADEQALLQVLVNLLVNAMKFTEIGHIHVGGSATEDAVSVWVEDTGIGMTEEVQGRVFERFEQGDASGTKVHGGVGLGLAISQALLERMGGRIELESTPGQGTRFTLVLPRVPGDACRMEEALAPIW